MRCSWSARACALGLALLAAPRALAQPAPLELDLERAVRMTLELSPEVRRAALEVTFREGQLREASGTFDTVLLARTTGGYVETELDPDSLQQELQRREGLFALAQTFAKLRDDIADRIAKRQFQPPICPPGFTSVRIEREAESEFGLDQPMCIPVGLGTNTPEGLSSRALAAILAPPGADLTGISSQLRDILGLPTDDRITELEQLAQEQLERSQRIAGLVADRTALALERLGLVPETEFRNTLALELRFDKPFRNGSLVGLEARLSGQEVNYVGKALDPAFGGLGLENEFRSGFHLAFLQPLGKGRGSVSAQAAEKAAGFSLEGSRRRHEHRQTEQVLATVQAHIELVAAQESLALLEQSVASQRAIFEAMQTLVKVGERARTELTRSQAGLSDAETGAAQARIAVLAARSELARVVGLDAAKAGVGPTARGSFPDALVELPDVEALLRQATQARLDLRAAEQEEQAATVAFDAARADLKRRIDLSLRVGAVSDYRSPFFRVLRDEFINDPNEPPGTPVDFYDPKGFWRSLTDKYLPEIRFQIAFDIPFGNNAARGRLERSQQSLRQSNIQTRDLARVIRENVAELGASLRSARAEVEQLRRAVREQDATWKTAMELQRAGELSLVDTLLTEKDLTSARLRLVGAQRTYASTLARLRFEAGTLVRFEAGRPVGFDLTGLPSPS
ncbi:MAG TPA: TolC family protein [Vicinamibacteria bacterium]|nr:TolC family protein [Vicinamibacteria bacterium]